MKRPSSLSISETVDSSAEPAFATSAGLRILAWNSAAERVFGHRAHDVIGRPCFEILQATDEAGKPFCGSKCPWLATLAEGQPVGGIDLWIRCADRRRVFATVSAFSLPGTGVGDDLVHLLNLSDIRQPADDHLPAVDAGTLTVSPTKSEVDSTAKYKLTDRESQVLLLLSQGKNTTRMADDLYISPATVRTHVRNLSVKLDVHTRLQAVIMAHRESLI